MQRRLAALPFALDTPLSDVQKAELRAAALEANDRYVIDFLEQHTLCPYARSGRERGATERHVLLAETADAEPVARIFEQACASQVEVVQIIFPLVQVPAASFASFVNDITQALNQCQERPVFASAALHPELGYRRETPAGLISLFRRAPDPTLQWVRLSALDAIYRGRKGGTAFVDINDIAALLEARPKRDLYDEIARANQCTAESVGIDAVERHLRELSQRTQESYRRILAR